MLVKYLEFWVHRKLSILVSIIRCTSSLLETCFGTMLHCLAPRISLPRPCVQPCARLYYLGLSSLQSPLVFILSPNPHENLLREV